ncbi:MAG: hypothetical protein QXP38_00115 [Nitrososphaerota archaeon]
MEHRTTEVVTQPKYPYRVKIKPSKTGASIELEIWASNLPELFISVEQIKKGLNEIFIKNRPAEEVLKELGLIKEKKEPHPAEEETLPKTPPEEKIEVSRGGQSFGVISIWRDPPLTQFSVRPGLSLPADDRLITYLINKVVKGTAEKYNAKYTMHKQEDKFIGYEINTILNREDIQEIRRQTGWAIENLLEKTRKNKL